MSKSLRNGKRVYGVVLGPWHLGSGKTQVPFTADPLQGSEKGLQRSPFLLTVLPLGLPSPVQQSLGPTSVRPSETILISPPIPPSPGLYLLPAPPVFPTAISKPSTWYLHPLSYSRPFFVMKVDRFKVKTNKHKTLPIMELLRMLEGGLEGRVH